MRLRELSRCRVRMGTQHPRKPLDWWDHPHLCIDEPRNIAHTAAHHSGSRRSEVRRTLRIDAILPDDPCSNHIAPNFTVMPLSRHTQALISSHSAVLGAVCVFGFTSACASPGDSAPGAPAPIGAVAEHQSPVPDHAGTPNLVVAGDGVVHLSWTERVDSTSHALRFATLKNSSWSPPRDIARGKPLFVNWADFSSMTVLDNGDLAAHWLEREGAGTYAYGVRIARSRDNGASWEPARTPHNDGLQAEHGFVSLWAAGGDAIGAVWLDGRKTAMPDSAREMTIRTTVIGSDPAPTPETLLDARACDCCQTSSAATASGRVIVYRDRTEEEIRDISILREVNGVWSEPGTVHADNWHFEACPVNGPSVASRGDTVAVAWFTGAQDTARVRVAVSVDGGATFGAAMRVDDGDPIGRTTVVLDDNALPLVMWMERTSDSSEVRVRRVAADGKLSPAVVVSRVDPSRRSGFPRMVRSGDQLWFAWTVPGDTMRVRVATASLK